MAGLSLVFEPLSFGNYKWQGEFGPAIRGPRAYSESAPLPLPSTIAGALAAALAAKEGRSFCDSSCTANGDPYCNVRKVLEAVLGCRPTLRGPYYYVKGREGGYVVCLHYHGNKLLCLGGGKGIGIVDTVFLQSIGIALNNLTRTVAEGYIYTMVSVDPQSLAEKIAKAFGLGVVEVHGVLVEVHGCENGEGRLEEKLRELNGVTVALGGEQRPHTIHVLEEYPLVNMLKQLIGGGEGCYYWHISSPVLFCKDVLKDCRNIQLQYPASPRRLLEEFIENVMGLKPCASTLLAPRGGKLVFSALGLGYSYCIWNAEEKRWVEGLRPYCPVVMPGWGVYARTANWLDSYVRGFSCHRDLAWGTIVPLPEDIHRKLALQQNQRFLHMSH